MPEGLVFSSSGQQEKFNALKAPLEDSLQTMIGRIHESLRSMDIRYSVRGRIKDYKSYCKKQVRLSKRLKDEKHPDIKVRDLIGIRIVVPFLEDLRRIEDRLRECFEVIEIERKGDALSFKEFGYEAVHLSVRRPSCDGEIIDPGCAEIQLRTILQDAWAEVEHEIVYKAEFNAFDEPLKRKLAALKANLGLSDIIFQEIRDYQHSLQNEIAKRREGFYRKIEESFDRKVLGDFAREQSMPPGRSNGDPIDEELDKDEMLLKALLAHNEGDIELAIRLYDKLLTQSLSVEIKSIILKHRGMAFFSLDKPDEALSDFKDILKLDPKNDKAAYHIALVHSSRADYEQAIKYYDLSLACNPFQFYAFYRRALAYLKIGDPMLALEDCEAALRIEPGNPKALRLKEALLGKVMSLEEEMR
jgi:putative GTP pyrophosphokinase